MDTKIIMIDSVLLNKDVFKNTIIDFSDMAESKRNSHSHNLIKAMLYLDFHLSLKLLTPLDENNTCTPRELLLAFEEAIHSDFSDIICMSLFPISGKASSVNSFLKYISEKAAAKKKVVFISLPNQYSSKENLYFYDFKNVFCTQMNRNIYGSISGENIFLRDETGKYIINITNMLVFNEAYGYHFWGGNSLANAYFAALYAKKSSLHIKKEYLKYNQLSYSEEFLEFSRIFNESFVNMMDDEKNVDLKFLLKPKYITNLNLFIKCLPVDNQTTIIKETFFLEDFYNSSILYNKIQFYQASDK